jgi:hypothetical protein
LATAVRVSREARWFHGTTATNSSLAKPVQIYRPALKSISKSELAIL